MKAYERDVRFLLISFFINLVRFISLNTIIRKSLTSESWRWKVWHGWE